MLLIDTRNVLQSNEFVWNQSHIPNIMHPVSIHSNKHVLCAILNHYINEIKWILAKVFGTFRDIVISSVIKPRPFWVFWWLRFFHLHIQTRRLVFVLNKSNKRKKLYPDITSYINYQVIKYTYHSFENRIFLLSSESNGSYWNKNEQKKNTRSMHEHYELICIKFQAHKIICIQRKQKLLWIIREKFYT